MKALSRFLFKLNWRQIFVHTIACLLLGYGFMLLAYLYNFSFWNVVFKNPNVHQIDANKLVSNMIFISMSQFAGLLTGSFISFFIGRKNAWFWVNSLIVFIIVGILMRIDIWQYIKIVFLKPGSLVTFGTVWYFIINGSVLLIASLLLFFLKFLIRFINHNFFAEIKEVSLS